MLMNSPESIARWKAAAEADTVGSNGGSGSKTGLPGIRDHYKSGPSNIGGLSARRRQLSVLYIDHRRGRTNGFGSELAKLGYAVELAPDGDVGLAKILSDPPDLILYDVSTLRLGGLEACLGLLEQLLEASPRYASVPLVLVSGEPGRDSEAGPSGDNCLAELAHLELMSSPPESPPRKNEARAPASPKALTDREKDILTWVARGKTSAEIAIILGLKERTINFHCDNAMKRLDVINRTQAVAKSIAEGLIGI